MHYFLKKCWYFEVAHQWRNRRGEGAGGSAPPPQRLLIGKFLLTYREKRGKGKREKGGKWRRKEGKIVKGKAENWKWGRKSSKMSRPRGLFFSFFGFSLVKTTKMCFGSTKMEIFHRKKAFHAEKKKIRKNDCMISLVQHCIYLAHQSHLW